MMKYRVVLLLIISFFAFNSGVSAAICDNEHISQLKELAKQVDVSYEYIDYSDEILNGEGNEYAINVYSVSVNLISDELYVVDDLNNKYYYDQSNGGVINFNVNSGKKEFTVYSRKCADYKLRTVYLELPKFNVYSYKSECNELEEYDLDVCNPWYQGTVNDSIFYKKIAEYLEDDTEIDVLDRVFSFFEDNYLIIGGVVVFLIVVVIGIVIHRKRSVLE